VGRASGIYWLYAFTSRHTLARFVTARGQDNRSWPFASVRGARLLDDTLHQLPAPCGLAVDVVGPSPMLLPPVVGIVPDYLAIDVHPRRGIADIDRPVPPGGGG
jgi:hypothetical protein